MKTFSLHLQDAEKNQQIDGLSTFVGEDESGSFGILAGHARMMSSLVFGLARFRIRGNPWQYLALPGALLYFVDNKLSISTERYMISDDYEEISAILQQQLVTEETEQQEIKKSLRKMEQELLKRLWEGSRDRKPLF
ncbi:MAG: F0F1 ATP synthase subunit epsilon [Gammaproteobacteria bacterium]|nr:MAG: F0F1 ATP synthase subunit epsilon [Gammaproteobacteria bacterium]RLA44100.1 MAG: F0F1 ATP synthase subunit epsilon [Gammaproteobacteria bacterium]